MTAWHSCVSRRMHRKPLAKMRDARRPMKQWRTVNGLTINAMACAPSQLNRYLSRSICGRNLRPMGNLQRGGFRKTMRCCAFERAGAFRILAVLQHVVKVRFTCGNALLYIYVVYLCPRFCPSTCHVIDHHIVAGRHMYSLLHPLRLFLHRKNLLTFQRKSRYEKAKLSRY